MNNNNRGGRNGFRNNNRNGNGNNRNGYNHNNNHNNDDNTVMSNYHRNRSKYRKFANDPDSHYNARYVEENQKPKYAKYGEQQNNNNQRQTYQGNGSTGNWDSYSIDRSVSVATTTTGNFNRNHTGHNEQFGYTSHSIRPF